MSSAGTSYNIWHLHQLVFGFIKSDVVIISFLLHSGRLHPPGPIIYQLTLSRCWGIGDKDR